VLIADDEIPYDDDRDIRTKETLLQNSCGATVKHYEKGRDGMRNACKVLRAEGFDLLVARSFKEASETIRRDRPFDVVIIDLGWMGDRDAPEPETAGWQLLDEVRNKEQGENTPVIMYSNRFDSTPTLAQAAVGHRTLPLPKTYTDGSHQTLVAAIRFLATAQQTPMGQLFSKAMEGLQMREVELSRLTTLCRWLLVAVGVVLIGGAVMLLLGATNSKAFQLVPPVLIGSMLALASRWVRSAAAASRGAMEDAEKHALQMQQQATPST
jgi:CheY-like chemotaxis protein